MNRTNVNLVKDHSQVSTKLTPNSYKPAPAPATVSRGGPVSSKVMVHGRYVKLANGQGEVVVAVDAGALSRKMAVIAATEDSSVSTASGKDSFFSPLSR